MMFPRIAMYRNILVPVDGSTTSNLAIQEAPPGLPNTKSKVFNLRLVHVVEPTFILWTANSYINYDRDEGNRNEHWQKNTGTSTNVERGKQAWAAEVKAARGTVASASPASSWRKLQRWPAELDRHRDPRPLRLQPRFVWQRCRRGSAHRPYTRVTDSRRIDQNSG